MGPVPDVLDDAELPTGFRYPEEFLRVMRRGVSVLGAWWMLDGLLLRARHSGLRARYPNRSLVPFALRQDTNDIACWDVDAGIVAVVDDLAPPGWERRAEYGDFSAWLRHAVDELLDEV